MNSTSVSKLGRLVLCLAAFLFSSRTSFAGQNGADSTSFYPLENGDSWEYFDYNDFGSGVAGTVTVSVMKDSIMSGQTYHLVKTYESFNLYPSYSLERRDSIGNVYQYAPASDSEEILYKLSDSTGVMWHSGNYIEVIDSVYSAQLFGSNRETLVIEAYRNTDTALTFPLGAVRLARGIGLVATNDNEGGGWGITGAIIAGTKFGTITSVRDNQQSVPSHFRLYQNYPNPFNPSTRFLFDISNASFVSLRVFDILGRCVATIVSQRLQAGEHSYDWTATGLASGVYFYQLTSGERVKVKELMLLK